MLCLCFSGVNLVPSANRHSWGGGGGGGECVCVY